MHTAFDVQEHADPLNELRQVKATVSGILKLHEQPTGPFCCVLRLSPAVDFHYSDGSSMHCTQMC